MCDKKKGNNLLIIFQ